MERSAPDSILEALPGLPRRQVKKGTVLLRQGDPSTHAYLVVQGCLRSFVLDGASKEHILQFAPEGWLVSDMLSFRDGSAASISIDALEDSSVVLLGRALLQQVEHLPPAILIRHLTAFQNSIIALNKRLVGLLSAPAEQRYQEFLTTYPSLARRLPLKYIAAYLGITPEFLSRIRKNQTMR